MHRVLYMAKYANQYGITLRAFSIFFLVLRNSSPHILLIDAHLFVFYFAGIV